MLSLRVNLSDDLFILDSVELDEGGETSSYSDDVFADDTETGEIF